jgi:integrase
MALTEVEFVEKLKAGEATVQDAIDVATSQPNTTDNARKRINALKSGFTKMGLNLSMPYKDLKDEATLKLFTREGSPDKSNRAGNLQALENGLGQIFKKYAISGVMEKVPGTDLEVAMYPQLAGAGTAAGTQRTGLAGERPMRGLLSMEDFTKIYVEAIPMIEDQYGQATADLIRYHATTANRPEQLQGLKKSDVTISGDKITVAGKKVTKTDKKGRPPLSFDLDSPTGQLLKRNLESSKSDFLFDTSDAKFTEAFNKHIGSRLQNFSDVLPIADVKVEGAEGIELSQKPVTTPSAIRSIVPKIMLDQYNVPEGLVQGMMGHVNDSILRRNYAGMNPANDIPKLLENPSTFAVGDFGTSQKTINLDLLSDEDRAALIEDQKATLIAEEKARQATAEATIAQQKTAAIKAKAAVTPEEIQAAARVDEETIRAKEERRLLEQTIKKEVRSKITAEAATDPLSTIPEQDVEKLKKLGLWERFGGKLSVGVLSGLGIYGALSDPAQAAADIAMETGARAVGFGLGPAAAVPMILTPTELASGELQKGDQPATQEELDTARIQAAQAVKERDAARIQESAIPSQFPNTDNFLNMQP